MDQNPISETTNETPDAKTPRKRYDPAIHRRVSLYIAETKKNKVIILRKDNFTSPEELDAYIKKLKADNRKKNADFKYQQKREHINKVMEGEPMPIESPPIKALQLSSQINPNIDTDTGSTFLILGSSKRGKTTLAMHLYDRFYAPNKKYISTLFSANPHLKIYKGDRKLIVGYGFGPDHANYVKMQQYINVKTKNRYKFLNIYDDIVDQKYNMVLKKSVLIYRNSNISSIICLQDPKDLEKKARASINHTFVFGCNTTENAREIIDMTLRPYFIDMGILDRDAMMRLYKEITHDHGFFYIDGVRGTMTMHRLQL